jgi:hypothetical protein
MGCSVAFDGDPIGCSADECSSIDTLLDTRARRVSTASMFKAATEAEARAQLPSLAHSCGDSTFAATMTRRHDEHGSWLVFRGPCPRCHEVREVQFHAGPGPAIPHPGARGGREEDELYGGRDLVCPGCDGAGESFQVGGDYASMEMARCFQCGGSGRVRG